MIHSVPYSTSGGRMKARMSPTAMTTLGMPNGSISKASSARTDSRSRWRTSMKAITQASAVATSAAPSEATTLLPRLRSVRGSLKMKM